MDQKPKFLGYYNYTVILTYIGMLTGFIGIIYAFESKIFSAVICLMVSGFFDMFDGAIASTRKRTQSEKFFGIQIDSFSDLVCFGGLPALIVYAQSGHSIIVAGICALYLLSALVRLAYFNVDEQERQQNNDTPREVYYGLPVTLAALIIPLFQGVACLFSWNPAVLLAAVLLIMAVLFLAPITLRKPKLPGKIVLIAFGILVICFVLYACKYKL